MRRDRSKFNLYERIYSKSSRSPIASILSKSIHMIKPMPSSPYPYFVALPKTNQQSAKSLVKSVKLPKINFSLTSQTIPEYTPTLIPLSKETEFSNSPRLYSIYESISNLEKSILAPKPLGFSALPEQDLSLVSKNFFSAIRLNKEIKVMKMLKKKKSLVFAKDSVGKTPLHWAIIRNYLEIAQVLIGFGADLNAVDYFNRPVKRFAKSEEALKLLNKFL